MSEESPASFESRILAPYAMHSADSAGRAHPEPAHPYRTPYQRDRDRIVHCSAFRRLAHKTQVLTGQMGDYHRSRLTHTLEVASIARTVGRALRLNEDLIEALALVHDIGHGPFGHAGEEVLDDCLADRGGFDHNRQALRIVELIERRYPDFPGLNLTAEVLSGQRSRVKGDGSGGGGNPSPAPAPSGRATVLLEVQVVDAADSIAYDAHDADDAVEMGLIELADLDASALWQSAAAGVKRRRAGLDAKAFRRATVHELIDLLVSDLLAAARLRLSAAAPGSAAEAQRTAARLIAPSPAVAAQQVELEQFLYARVYRHADVLAQRELAGQALREMFAYYLDRPAELPPKFAAISDREGVSRATADYLAGMTDHFALAEHARLIPPAR